MAKRSGWKIVLIVLAILVGLGLLGAGICVLSGYLWVQDNVPAMREAGERGQSEARAFAAGRAQTECIDEGLRRHDACGAGMAIMCRSEARIFVDVCLREATPSPGLCDGVPARTDIMQGASWALQYCRDHGRANDQHCGNFIRALVDHCGRP